MLLFPVPETPVAIRRRNRFAVLNALRSRAFVTKSELVHETGLTPPTIASILDGIIEEGLARTIDEPNGYRGLEATRGRPSSVYALRVDAWAAGGIQIASDTVTALLLSLDGTVVDSARVTAPRTMPPDAVLQTAIDLLRTLLGRSDANGCALLGIGVALEGIADAHTGRSISMPYRIGWENVPVAQALEREFGVPVLVDWRVYAAALAEVCYGAARNVSDFVYLNVDTGVAVASVASGILARSSEAFAGSSGDLSHLALNGGSRLCYCGNTGCIQTEITIPALLIQLEEMIRLSQAHGGGHFWQTHDLTLDNLIAAAEQGDPIALQLRNRLAQQLVAVVRSAILLFSANRVILGGPVVRFGGASVVEASETAAQRLALLHSLYGATRVVVSALKPDSATVGAAALIIQAVFDGRLSVSGGVPAAGKG